VNFHEKKEKIVIFTLEKRIILSFPNIFVEKMKKQFGGGRKEKKHQLGIGTIILTCFVFFCL
jgi:hypothetical protein